MFVIIKTLSKGCRIKLCSNRDLPLAIQDIMRDFLESWLGCPWWVWTITCHAPLIIGDLSLEVSSHLKWLCFLREFLFIRYSLCEFLCCGPIAHMQTSIFKQCKVYVCLEVFWKCIFIKSKNFVRIWIQLRIYSMPYRSQDTFCNSMLSN